MQTSLLFSDLFISWCQHNNIKIAGGFAIKGVRLRHINLFGIRFDNFA